MHVPGDTYVTSAPDTVHTLVVSEEYDTAKFDDAVPASVTLPEAKLSSSGFANVIVCATLLISNDCVTSAAASQVPFPACDAVMVQVPPATKDISEPDTVHTSVVVDA